MEDERNLDGFILTKIMEIPQMRIKSGTLIVDQKHQRVFFTDRIKKKVMVGNLRSSKNYRIENIKPWKNGKTCDQCQY